MRSIKTTSLLVAAGTVRVGHALLDLSQPYPKSSTFPTADGEALIAIGDEWEDIHAFLAIDCGRVVAEYGDQSEVRHLFSITKSWTGLVLGVAESEGLLSLDETLGSIWPDDAVWEGIEDAEDRKTTTLEQLVQMRGGYDMPGDFMQDVLVDALPFTDNRLGGESLQDALAYHPLNTTNIGKYKYVMAANILSYVIQEKTGMMQEEFAKEKIFPFLGITEDDYEWYVNPDDMNTAFHGLKMNVPALSKLGMLFLQEGMASDDKRLLDKSWIERSLTIGDENAKPGDKFGYIGWWIEEIPDAYATYGFGGQRLSINMDTHRLVAIESQTYYKEAGLQEYDTPNKKYPTDLIKEWAFDEDWGKDVPLAPDEPEASPAKVSRDGGRGDGTDEVCYTKAVVVDVEPPVEPVAAGPDDAPKEEEPISGGRSIQSLAAFLFAATAAVIV